MGFLFTTALFVLLILRVRCDCVDSSCTVENQLVDYVVVGAGSAGLQVALYLHKFNMSYVVLERNSTVGSFWANFPVFRELISINKWVADERQLERYDWHSLLEAPHRMLSVTEDYFPSNGDFRRYLAKVAATANLTIEFDVTVDRVRRMPKTNEARACAVTIDGRQYCARRRVFVGTGLREKREPLLSALGGIPYSRMRRDMAYHKRVCILGNGNSGYEVAQNTYDVADRVIIYGRRPARLSAVTRYTGDVRIKYLQVVENLHGKLLDTALSFVDWPHTYSREDFTPAQELAVLDAIKCAGWLRSFNCSTFVYATGFESYVPGRTFRGRFPPTNDWYVDKLNPAVHYIGWLMHERDFRSGPGGFLSGFRYLIRNLLLHVRQQDDGAPYPHLVLDAAQLTAHVVARTQYAADVLLAQDGITLRDVLVKRGDNLWHYYEGVTFDFMPTLHNDALDVLYFYFRWGDGRRVANVFEETFRYSDTRHLINLFLHPVIENSAGLVRDINEDLGQEWQLRSLVDAITTTMQQAIAGNFSLFLPKKQYPYTPQFIPQQEPPNFYEAGDLKNLPFNERMARAVIRAVEMRYSREALDNVTQAMQDSAPSLFE